MFSERTARRLLEGSRPVYRPQPGVVLMVTDTIGRGGAERQMLVVTQGLQERGYSVRLLCLAKLDERHPSYEAEFHKLGVFPTFANAAPAPMGARFTRPISGLAPSLAAAIPAWLKHRMLAISAAIKQERPEIVHAWQDIPGTSAAVAAALAGVPHILVQQGSMAINRRGHPATTSLRNLYRALDAHGLVSVANNCSAGARDNEEWLGWPRGRIGVLYNGLTAEAVRRVSKSEVDGFRQRLGIPRDHLVVGTVMRFDPVKDPDLWLETARCIADARPDVRFVVGGHGPLATKIASSVEQLGLGDRIHMVGPLSDVGLAYAAMDVVLMSSKIEGVPNVLIEAQSIGCAVVAPDVGGCSEAVVEGATGIIARPRSAASLSEAVLRILADKAFRARASLEGPRFVAERFGANRMLDETVRAYGLIH